MSKLPLNVTGYYMGGETGDDGEFEATFLIESPDLDKDDWPTVTFTGEQFRASFANLTQYHRVTLNLAEGSAKERTVKLNKCTKTAIGFWSTPHSQLLGKTTSPKRPPSWPRSQARLIRPNPRVFPLRNHTPHAD